MATRRTPPPTEPPVWVRIFNPRMWDCVDLNDPQRVHEARTRWNEARFAWCAHNAYDALELIRAQAAARLRRLGEQHD